jgi:hypothetical protein
MPHIQKLKNKLTHYMYRKLVEKLLLCVALFIVIAASSQPASATIVTYSAMDLPDINVGEDLWRYSYVVDGFPSQDIDVQIMFNYATYSDLSIGGAIPVGLDAFTTQSDLSIPADGSLDIIVFSGAAAPTFPIYLDFVWHGSGAPGSQSFTVYDPNDPNFAAIDGGQTAPAGVAPPPPPPPPTVPEPGIVYLILLGLGLLALQRRRRWPLVRGAS